MGTRAKIRIEANGRYLSSKYIHMDGHIENWAPMLITALNQTTPENILKNRQLLKFMFEDHTDDDFLSYLCVVDVSNKDYKIKIYGFGKELLFEGTLDEFADKYDEIH